METLRFRDFSFDATPAHFQGGQRAIEEIRLIVVDAAAGAIHHDRMANIGAYFTGNDTLVWNDVGIARSRLGGVASAGQAVDVCFLLRDTQDEHVWDVVVLAEQDPPQAGSFALAVGAVRGEFLGKTLDFDAPYYIERDRYRGYRGRVRIEASAEELRRALQASGAYMHPWYVNLNDLPESALDPLTARKPGSVLLSEPARRFTAGMLADLRARRVAFMYVSLALSFSWQEFTPDQRLMDYAMSAEDYAVSQPAVDLLTRSLKEGRRIVSIGTSGIRALESLPIPPTPATGRTTLFVSPGFRFKYCDALLTNLHNPRGTHVIMACAVGGHELVLEACRQAADRRYRFGINGDSMLILGNHEKLGARAIAGSGARRADTLRSGALFDARSDGASVALRRGERPQW
jgi:S-adenosylmethionine:tRNA ribosyltransferase-isomerase